MCGKKHIQQMKNIFKIALCYEKCRIQHFKTQ